LSTKENEIPWNTWIVGHEGKTVEELNAAAVQFTDQLIDLLRAQPLGPLVAVQGALRAVAYLATVADFYADSTKISEFYQKMFQDALKHNAQTLVLLTAKLSTPEN